MRHVAIIPARAGSQGIPNKNRLLFAQTADFIDGCELFDAVYVSSNDDHVLDLARSRGYHWRRRPEAIAGPRAPIKPTLNDLVEHFGLEGDAYLWLFYLAFPSHDLEHFIKARKIIDETRCGGMIAFLPAKTHPYFCWRVDPETGLLSKFIDVGIVSRQDFPPAYSNHHYISCNQVSFLPKINDNLIGPETTPFFMTEAEGDALIDLNEMDDFHHWAALRPDEYARWWSSISPAERPHGSPTPVFSRDQT